MTALAGIVHAVEVTTLQRFIADDAHVAVDVRAPARRSAPDTGEGCGDGVHVSRARAGYWAEQIKRALRQPTRGDFTVTL